MREGAVVGIGAIDREGVPPADGGGFVKLIDRTDALELGAELDQHLLVPDRDDGARVEAACRHGQFGVVGASSVMRSSNSVGRRVDFRLQCGVEAVGGIGVAFMCDAPPQPARARNGRFDDMSGNVRWTCG